MSYKFLKNKKGFSLVEMLIVAAIMIFMTGVLFVNQNSKKAATDVELAARQIASQIRALQNEALNGKRFGAVNACKFKFNAPLGNSYNIKYYSACPTPPATTPIPTEINSTAQTVSLAKKRVTLIGPDLTLYFSSPNGKIDATKTIKIRSTVDTNICASVTVSADGSVTEQKNVSCTT